MANILNNQYQIIFSTPKNGLFLASIHNCWFLNDVDILDDDIKEAIKDINNYSAPGPDGIPPTFYKEFVDKLIIPIRKSGEFH